MLKVHPCNSLPRTSHHFVDIQYQVSINCSDRHHYATTSKRPRLDMDSSRHTQRSSARSRKVFVACRSRGSVKPSTVEVAYDSAETAALGPVMNFVTACDTSLNISQPSRRAQRKALRTVYEGLCRTANTALADSGEYVKFGWL